MTARPLAPYGRSRPLRPLAPSASLAVRDQGQVAAGLTNTTHFLRSVTEGRVNVEATALSQGRTQQLWRVDITDEAGRLIAHGELRLQNLVGK